MKDAFKRAGAKSIGPGGMKCPCCNDYHTWGNHAKRDRSFSQLRRSRLNQELKDEVDEALEEENENNS
jgi:hypothetical protein